MVLSLIFPEWFEMELTKRFSSSSVALILGYGSCWVAWKGGGGTVWFARVNHAVRYTAGEGVFFGGRFCCCFKGGCKGCGCVALSVLVCAVTGVALSLEGLFKALRALLVLRWASLFLLSLSRTVAAISGESRAISASRASR